MDKNKPLILAVDDQPNNLKVLSSVLNAKYSLSIANNGIMALKILEKVKPDLILLDVMMPQLNGFDTCKKIKEIPEYKDIPIIFLTAKAEVDDVVKAFELGAVDYITKPFNIPELRVRIENHLSLYNAKRMIEKQKNELESYNDMLQKSEAELKLVNQEKDKFFSIIAHDLKGPFSGLIGLLHMLTYDKHSFSEEERDEILESLYHSSKNVFSLLENLLEWSRIKRKSIVLNSVETFPYSILKILIELLDTQAKSKNINISTSINKNLSVYADEMMLNTIFRNLISNSIKFTNIGGKIIITHSKDNNIDTFCVEDNGIGMKDNIKENLFRIDRKVYNIGTNDEKGTGLGLILCKEFVEMHGGKIWAESEVGTGSKFYFTIPDKP